MPMVKDICTVIASSVWAGSWIPYTRVPSTGVGRWFGKGGLYRFIGKDSMISVYKIESSYITIRKHRGAPAPGAPMVPMPMPRYLVEGVLPMEFQCLRPSCHHKMWERYFNSCLLIKCTRRRIKYYACSTGNSSCSYISRNSQLLLLLQPRDDVATSNHTVEVIFIRCSLIFMQFPPTKINAAIVHVCVTYVWKMWGVAEEAQLSVFQC